MMNKETYQSYNLPPDVFFLMRQLHYTCHPDIIYTSIISGAGYAYLSGTPDNPGLLWRSFSLNFRSI